MKLFEPIKIGKMEVKNRIGLMPMIPVGYTEISDGRFSQKGIDFYAARAKGGAGLIIAGSCQISRTLEWGIHTYQPTLHDPSVTPRLNELAEAVHHYGAKIVLNLAPGVGRVKRTFTIQPIGPSVLPCFWNPKVKTRELTIEEIEGLVKAMEQAARICKVAEIDAIEIHGYGGYLLDTFNTALWNKRTDKYGGDLDGRLRFSMELINAIKSGAGEDFPIIYKFSPKHYIEGGRELEEGLEIARRLEKAGVAALHVDAGCYEAWNRAIPPIYEPPGSQLELAAAVKKVVKVPVIAQGKLGDPAFAEWVLQEGKADLIGLARPLLADPEWSLKVKQGRLDDIRPCIGDHDGCLSRAFSGKYLSCTVNPMAGAEREYPLTPTVKRKSVLVVGAGPAGLEAARVAALRGHDVVLWEKNSKLGGNLIPASVPSFKQDIRGLIDYLTTQVNKLGVKIELMKEATPEMVQQMNPDAVIIATGALSLVPEIPGIRGDNVFSAADLFLGRKEAREKVLVAGGGMVGCEVAVYLAQRGKKVTIIEIMEQLIPEEINLTNRLSLLGLVKESKAEVLTGTRLLEITKEGAIIGVNGPKRALKVDSVVLALGFKPDSRLKDALEGKVPEVFAVGDCVKPRRIMNAIWEGFHTARLI